MNENWKFSDIPYTRPDVEALQARYDALTRRARDAAGPEELLQVVRDRDALQQEVSLCQSIATIRAFHDVTDAFYQTEFQETLPRLETLDSQSLAQAIVESPYAQAVDACTDLTVPAHASGTVTEVYVHVGDYVNTGTAIASLVDSANLTLTVPFAAEDAAAMAPIAW